VKYEWYFGLSLFVVVRRSRDIPPLSLKLEVSNSNTATTTLIWRLLVIVKPWAKVGNSFRCLGRRALCLTKITMLTLEYLRGQNPNSKELDGRSLMMPPICCICQPGPFNSEKCIGSLLLIAFLQQSFQVKFRPILGPNTHAQTSSSALSKRIHGLIMSPHFDHSDQRPRWR
jgi:hypothetical protein